MNKNLTIIISLIFILLAQTIIQAQQNTVARESADLRASFLTKITKEDLQILFADFNAAALKSMAADAESRKATIENLKDLLAVASQAVKESFADNPAALKELKDIRSQIVAVEYDRELNKDKTTTVPFALITEERIKEFYVKAENQTDFDEFIKNRLMQVRDGGAAWSNHQLTEDETAQAREYFAKMRIYEIEAGEKAESLGAAFNHKIELKVKLQQAQYLAQLYKRKVLDAKSVVTEAETGKYLAENPLLDPKILKAKAYWIFLRARAGEDFAKLAAEFSDEPESKEKGGLLENVNKGTFVAEFERAALSLEAGQVYPELVETKYGFHVMKLEKKQITKDADGKETGTYNVRHVLISTVTKDARSNFLTLTFEQRVKAATEKRLIAEIKAVNPVEVEDFEIPAPVKVDLPADLPADLPNDKSLPAEIKTYLDQTFAGWELSASKEGCKAETNNGVVSGNFNDDEKPDYAVKFTRGEKGYIIAFIAKKQNYKTFVLHDDYTVDEVSYVALGMMEKGETFVSEEKSIVLKRDAPSDFRCESDVGGIHFYRRGKFKGL